MIRIAFLAAPFAFGALSLASPAAAQSISQSDLEARYDRALAAGYKAMFLCSAIANAERNGTMRTPESVMEWELTGIQSPLNEIVDGLRHRIERGSDEALDYVAVDWSDNENEARVAVRQEFGGCAVLPMGMPVPDTESELAPIVRETGDEYSGLVTRYDDSEHAALIPRDNLQQFADSYSRALTGGYGSDSRTTAVIIAREGVVLADGFARGFGPRTPQRTWSVAKSIAATLVGAAVYRGEADVTASAGLGESDIDPRRVITIDDGLRMATGRYSNTPGNRTDALYFGGATVDEVAVDWPLVHGPGTVFRYANNDTLIAQQAIEHTFAEHPPSTLFEAIGMTGTVAETDWQGNYILSSQVWATAPDLLLLGQLYLNDGVLPDGTRILPEGWVEYVSTPSGPQPNGANGWGYGAGWWLLNNHEGIPADTILAAGNRGQYIVVIPSRDIVIVRRGEDPAGGSGFDIEAFTRDVLSAL